ncbi:MAG: hypothetical protein J6X10_07050 [Bacteroidales bacterium]|nr:hypothetical protein [Bacteroidales bacterium]
MATHCYRLTAPRNLGKIPKGYQIQVPSDQLGHPTASETRDVLKRMGWDDYAAASYASSGNWNVEEM